MNDGGDMHLAIIACGGSLPGKILEAAQDTFPKVTVIGITGAIDPSPAFQVAHMFRLGEVGSMLKYLQGIGVTHIVMAGLVQRPSLLDLKPDLATLNLLRRHRGALFGGDDQMLSRISNFLQGQGLTVLGPHDVDPTLLANDANFNVGKISPLHKLDLEFSIDTVRSLGPLDIGQSIVVHQGSVIAVEAREGTDAMLQRVGELRKNGRLRGRGALGILVKYAKIGQDLRVDTPVVGLKTLELASEMRLAGVAVQGSHVLLMQQEDSISFARKKGLFLKTFDLD